jgi:deazaflavin-dependent oxidoreductase (nitroreductase family)
VSPAHVLAGLRTRRWFGLAARVPQVAWHLGLGPVVGRFFVVLTTTGRRSGRPRHTMTFYARSSDRIYVACLYGPASNWFRNLLANPICTVRTAAGVSSMSGRPVTSTEELAIAVSGGGVARRIMRVGYGRSDPRDAFERLRDTPLIALHPSSELGPEPLEPRWPWAGPLIAAAVAAALTTRMAGRWRSEGLRRRRLSSIH